MYWKQNLNGNFNSKSTFCLFLLSFIIKKFLHVLKKQTCEQLRKDYWSEVVEILLFWAVVGICCAGQIWVMLLKCCICCIS